jgi:hypothetical protein
MLGWRRRVPDSPLIANRLVDLMRHRSASALWPAVVLDSGGSLKLLDPLQGAVDEQSLSRLSDAIAVLLESEAVAAPGRALLCNTGQSKQRPPAIDRGGFTYRSEGFGPARAR